jgi:hypothetical protein
MRVRSPTAKSGLRAREALVDVHRKLVDERKSFASRSIEVCRKRVPHYSFQSDSDVDFNQQSSILDIIVYLTTLTIST